MILRDKDYSDKEYDGCGNTAIAVLEHNYITIPLCSECLKDLLSTVNDYKYDHHIDDVEETETNISRTLKIIKIARDKLYNTDCLLHNAQDKIKEASETLNNI